MTRTNVLFGNNYPMAEARRLWEAGVYARQHLWAALDLEGAGMRVDYIPFDSSRSLKRLTDGSRWRLGDLSQQWDVVRRATRGSVCYAGDQHSFKGLAGLRILGLWRRPIVAVVHQEPRGRLESLLLRGVDLVICISARVARAVANRRTGARAITLPWGPALEYPGYVSTGESFVVSAGKSNRDLATLFAALRGLDCKARVYAPEGAKASRPENAELVSLDAGVHLLDGVRHLTFEEALNDLREASVVAIPLEDPDRLSGLSELNDALALGKPVVMTRTPYIDVDLEAVGCGIWVEPGDVAGWRAALRALTDDPGRRHEMGRRGRTFAEASWNADLFGRGVVDAIHRVAGR